jgi:LacI family transcriptional regulator
MRRVTLKDIAREAGVSLMTVSYALRGSKKVSDATRKRVELLAGKLGYQPDPMMKRLASYRGRLQREERGITLGWLNLHPTNATWNFRGSHFIEAFEGAQKRAVNVGYQLESFCVPKLGGWKRTNNVLHARGIQGVIIGQPPAGVRTAELEWSQFATVAIGRAITSPDLPRVLFNHVDAVTRLIQQLRGVGYRRIGLVMEREECVKNSFRNVSAYYGAMERFEIADSERVSPLLPDRLEAKELGEWIRRHRVEVIIVHRHDQMQQMLPKLGLRVPDDIGFAHLSLHTESKDISGLVFEPENYGSWAVDLVHWLLDREETGLHNLMPSLMLSSTRWNPGQSIRLEGR